MRGGSSISPYPDFQDPKYRLNIEISDLESRDGERLVGDRTSITPRVVLNGVILFSTRILDPLRFPESSRHSPCSLFLVYNLFFSVRIVGIVFPESSRYNA